MPVISFRLSEEEKNAIEAVTNAQGAPSPANFCKAVSLREAGMVAVQPRIVRRIADRDVLRSLLGELGRHGSLLNQIARALHLGGSPSAATVELAAMRAAYEIALNAATTALGVGKSP